MRRHVNSLKTSFENVVYFERGSNALEWGGGTKGNFFFENFLLQTVVKIEET